MLLGFKSIFAPFVADGSKTHTIRAKRKVRPRVGEICHCYTGLRQKGARLLGRFDCIGIDDIRIDLPHDGIAYRVRVLINGQELSEDETRELARRDGFRESCDPIYSFGAFWEEVNGLCCDGPPFVGDLIHWRFKA